MKRNKFTLVLAILLLATMLLTSCNPDDNGITGNTPPLVNRVDNDHSAAIGAWAEYLSFIAPEKAPSYSSSVILSDLKTLPDVYDEILVVEEETENYKTVTPAPAEGEGTEGAEPPEPIEVLVSTSHTEKWYSKNSGELIKTFTSVTAAKTNVEGVLKYDDTIDPLTLVNYTVNYDEFGLIKVETATLALIETEEGAEPLDLKAVSSYEEKTSISYYFADGKLFLEGLTESLGHRNVENYSAIDADRYLLDSEELGKTFLMGEYGVVCEFGYKLEHDIPVYNENSVSIDGIGYAYFEKNGNKYLVMEDAPVYMPMGDLYLYLVQGMSISVTDKNDRVLVNYETSCYGISGYAVLSNGNIYVCEFELLNRDATEYDILSGEDKLNVNHKLISISDGSVTKLDLSYKASKLFNNTTKDIKSFLNYATLGIESSMEHTLLDSAQVKDGYILAEIQKYEAGNLDTATTWAVLDESFKIVKELPAIIADQFTYPSFMDADTMIVSARTVGNKIIYYGANVNSGEIKLLPDLNELQEVEILNNGYFWDEKVYDKDWKVLFDFDSKEASSSGNVYANFMIVNGDLYYFTQSASLTEPSTKWSIHKLTINATKRIIGNMTTVDPETGAETTKDLVDYDYNYSTNRIFELAELYYTDEIVVKEIDKLRKFYGLDGKLLIEELSYTENVMSEKLNTNVEYKVTKKLSDIEKTDNGYFVRMALEYKRNDSSTASESGLPDSFTEYEYCIIK